MNANRTEQLAIAHKASINNRELLSICEQCACFYCFRIFPPSRIEEWIDKKEAEGEGQTALCPFCGVDSIIPSPMGVSSDAEFLQDMHDYWFGAEK